jgi:hypothetical protein
MRKTRAEEGTAETAQLGAKGAGRKSADGRLQI